MIIMDKRAVVEIFSQSLTKLWNEWQLRAIVLLSLFLQIVLVPLGNRRKYIPKVWLRFILWLAYSPAYSIAAVSIGVLLCQGGGEDNPSQQIRAFWAPFVLLHLGGPDTISAYSLEDNELWTRHLLGLFMQSLEVSYILVRSWKGTSLNFLAIPMFVAGLIKYVERTCFLKSVSNNEFRKSTIPPLDPGPNYALIMANHDYLKETPGDDVSLRIDQESDGEDELSQDADHWQGVNKFFPNLKLLFTDFVLDSTDLEKSKSFFKDRSWMEAFRMIETELAFVYDMLYTKAMVAYHERGAQLRFLCLSLLFLAFMAFLIIDRHEYSTVDVFITFFLLVGAILLEIYSIILLFSSDWTMRWSSNQEKTRVNLNCLSISSCRLPLLFPANKRWSDSMAQFSLLSYSLKNFPIKFSEVWMFFCISHKVVPKYLKSIIFKHLKGICQKDPLRIKEAKKLCGYRGEWTLKDMKCWSNILGSSVGGEFSESMWGKFDQDIGGELDGSILLWHLATDLCYCTDLDKNSSLVKNSDCEASKLLSDYMVYLLMMRPLMLPDGIGQIRFRDTCAAAREFFRSGRPVKDRIQACKKLLQVNTEIIAPSTVRGKSKSVLFDACILAKSLQSLETEEGWDRENKWKMISHVWVEMLCYAACHCRWNHHAEQLRRGGELLTHVWLLMVHFGITEHFRDSHKYARARAFIFLINGIQPFHAKEFRSTEVRW